MKSIVKLIVIVVVLSCTVVSAQETFVNTVEISDSLSLYISNCNKYEVPREFLKYRNSYSNVAFFAGLVFNDSVYHDSTELQLKSVVIYER